MGCVSGCRVNQLKFFWDHSVTFEKSWRLGEVSNDWRKALSATLESYIEAELEMIIKQDMFQLDKSEKQE